MNIRHIVLCVILVLAAWPQTVAAADRFLDIKSVKSPGGIEAWLVEDHTLPIIALEFAFRDAGTINDPKNRQGLGKLLSNMLDEGAGDLDSQAFQKALTDHSISLSYNTNRDDFRGSLKCLTRHADRAFDMLRLSLTAPRFDAEPLARMKAANVARIRSSLSDPEWIAARILNDRAFAGHPYAMNSGGTISGLNAVTADDLRRFLKTNLTRGRLVVAATGDITADELGKRLDQVFGILPDAAPDTKHPTGTVQNAGKTFLYKKDIPQTIIEIMQPGISSKDPDIEIAKVMNFILGGSGFGSRLMEEVREKRGLTYGIYSGFYDGEYLQGISISTSTANKNASEAIKLIGDEFKRMRDTPVAATELAAAKSYMIGSMPLSLSSTNGIAGLILSMQMNNRPIDYLDNYAARIESVTIQDIANISKRLLAPESFTTVIVGMPETMDAKAEIVTEIPEVE